MTFDEVENARKAYQAKRSRIYKRGFILIGIVFLISLVIAISLGITTSNFFGYGFIAIIGSVVFTILFSFVILALIVAFTTSKDATNYRRAYKAYFVAGSMARVFTNLNYHHEAALDRNVLRATGMVNTGDRYSSNDLTIAKYKDVSFAQADAHIQTEYTDSDGNTHYTTIFKGRFMIFEFPKKFNFRLEVIGKSFHASLIPGKDKTTGRKMSRIKTESPDFNKTFRTYAEDGFEAFYLLDPAFIDKIQNIGETYRYSILLGFIENRLLIGLSDGKDSFEPPAPSKPLDEAAELAKISADIKVITDFVDLLKLDRKLFQQ